MHIVNGGVHAIASEKTPLHVLVSCASYSGSGRYHFHRLGDVNVLLFPKRLDLRRDNNSRLLSCTCTSFCSLAP